MRTPIACAWSWPDRAPWPAPRLDLAADRPAHLRGAGRGALSGADAWRATRCDAGGGAPAAMNAANEVAVAAFLDRRIGFLDIAALVAETLDELDGAGDLTQDEQRRSAGMGDGDRCQRTPHGRPSPVAICGQRLKAQEGTRLEMLAILANAAIYVVPFLIVITVIVTVHEFGHFLTARAFGVAVDRFSIGFGRAIFVVQGPLGRRVADRLVAARRLRALRRRRERRQRAGPGRSRRRCARASRLREGVGAEQALLLLQAAVAAGAGRRSPGRRPTSSSRSRSSRSCSGRWASRSASMKVLRRDAGSAAAAAGVKPGDV